MANLIRATNLWGYDELLIKRGNNPLPLLAKHNLPPAAKRDDQSFLIYSDVAALFEDTALELNFPDLGLRLAEYQGMDILGPISVIARSAPTVGEASFSISRYLHLHCPALNLSFVPEALCDPASVRLHFNIKDDNSGYPAQAYELSLANMRQVMKLLCGNDFHPFSVHFMHQRASAEGAYNEVFQCPSYFEQTWCGFELPADVFSWPLSSADHQTWKLAADYLASQQAPTPVSLTENVVRLIHTLLPVGQCSSDSVAAGLSIHKRTLHRKLEKEGTTFEKILDRERQQLAQKYLADPNMKLSQIAGLIGYSEQSSLNRASRSWFKMTPKQYRSRYKYRFVETGCADR